MRVIQLHGSHYQMGLQHGRQLADLRSAVAEAAENRLSALQDRPTGALLDELEKVWAVSARSTIDMLAGMAVGLDLDRNLLFRYAAASYLQDRLRDSQGTEGCTVWAASDAATAGGAPILTKNRDFNAVHLKLQVLALATPQDGYRYLYVTGAGSPGVYSSGMNEKGLAVADSYVSCSDNGPGLPRYSLMMDLLEHHSSVASALDYLKAAPRMGPGNLVLADASGAMAVFEVGHSHWGVVPPATDFVVATNHFVTPVLREYSGRRARSGTDGESEARYRSASEWLADVWGRIDGDEAQRIMSYHSDLEGGICRHDTGDGGSTISNVIFFPAERSLLFCNGRPCEGGYTHHSL